MQKLFLKNFQEEHCHRLEHSLLIYKKLQTLFVEIFFIDRISVDVIPIELIIKAFKNITLNSQNDNKPKEEIKQKEKTHHRPKTQKIQMGKFNKPAQES
jgi:hypothetical protein